MSNRAIGAPTLRAIRLAASPGSSEFEAAPMNAKITHITTNAPIARPRHTHTLTSPLAWVSEGIGEMAGSLPTGIATGNAGTGMSVPHPGHAMLLPAAASDAIAVFLHVGQLMWMDMLSPECSVLQCPFAKDKVGIMRPDALPIN